MRPPSCLLLFLTVSSLFAQGLDYVKANYTKHEFEIAMRDGKKLFTSVYVPKDDSKPYPILMSRTPYSVAPYGVDQYKADLGPNPRFGKDGFIFVYQDVRGRLMSEGEFVNMRPHRPHKTSPAEVDESSDTYDTIDWLVKNIPNNNGNVGMWGISYPGFYAAMAVIDAHPALKAVSPQAPISDWFIGDDFHHNGALYLVHAFNFLVNFGHPRPEPTTKWDPPFIHGTADSYKFFLDAGTLANLNEKYMKNGIPFWNEMTHHGAYDTYWQERNIRPHLKNVKPAVMTVGGWFDAEDLFGALHVYESIEKNSPGAQNMLVMGPWFHGGWARADGSSLGQVHFNSKTSEYYRERIEFPFFTHYLKGGPDPKLPEAMVFETGTNVWRKYETWPPRNVKPASLFLQADGKLGWTAPKQGGAEFDEYISDPNKPVPFSNEITIDMTREHMVDDQRFASTRPDVLVYQTGVLDRDVTIAGPISADIRVSTTGTDSDWVVKVIDVYPDDYQPGEPPAPSRRGGVPFSKMGGYQQLLRGEVMRGKFRTGYSTPQAFKPGEVTKVEYTMPDVCHTFRKGHRIMVQIQSSWFPLVDRNPQQFLDIFQAKSTDFKKATQHVYHTPASPSSVRLMIQQ